MQCNEIGPLGHGIVSRAQWLRARAELLDAEKELRRQRDELARWRRELPWVKVAEDYRFDTPRGRRRLSELFDGRSQLIVNHFMLGPGWKEARIGWSVDVDDVDGALMQLNAHDVTYVAVSRAPLAEICHYQRRMGWTFPWVSSCEREFDFDFGVSFNAEERAAGEVDANSREDELPQQQRSWHSVFFKGQRGEVYHTYSTHGVGLDALLSTQMLLDVTPRPKRIDGRPSAREGGWLRKTRMCTSLCQTVSSVSLSIQSDGGLADQDDEPPSFV